MHSPPSACLISVENVLNVRSDSPCSLLFFFNAPATTEIYTLSLHDALPISGDGQHIADPAALQCGAQVGVGAVDLIAGDRKSTRLNSSHSQISYAVFCLKKKITQIACPSSICKAVTSADVLYPAVYCFTPTP